MKIDVASIGSARSSKEVNNIIALSVVIFLEKLRNFLVNFEENVVKYLYIDLLKKKLKLIDSIFYCVKHCF